MNRQAGVAAPGSLRVIGDVHGEIEPFERSVFNALQDGRYVVQLGDLIDHGPDSPMCLRTALDLVRGGRGIFLRGNHENDLVKYCCGQITIPSVKLWRTVRKFMSSQDSLIINEFLDVWPEIPWWLYMKNHLFVHGVFHLAMLDHLSPGTITDRDTRASVELLSLYGEGPAINGDNLPPRTYAWIETVPDKLTVVVGHDVRSTQCPVMITNSCGGRVTFLDTGSGKGGQLSWIDIELA
jgi:hypothetical protein